MSEENRRKARQGARRNASGRDEDNSHANGPRNARTAGKDRDLDRSGESKNQGHGHPREERSGSAGRSGSAERSGSGS